MEHLLIIYGCTNGNQTMNEAQNMSDKLTGKYCFTSSMWGNLILWVEVASADETYTYWRKARVFDLPKLNLKQCDE